MKTLLRLSILATSLFLTWGCGSQTDVPNELVFWHVMTQENARLLEEIVDDYNASNPPMPVSLRFSGNYTTMFQKVRATVDSGKRPDLVVAYPSMVAEYIRSGAAIALDDMIHDPEVGLSESDLADFFPSMLANCRYSEHGDRYYTFPFTKSILMTYVNMDMLRAGGFERPAETWSEFREQCLAMESKLGKKGYALSVDASTVAAMIYSLGGEIISDDQRQTVLDQEPTIEALRAIQEMVRSGAAYQIDRQSYQDRKEFASQNAAYMMRSSTTRPYLASDIQGAFDWTMTVMPHAPGLDPVTVMFGADIAILQTTPERQQAAWAFIKYFSSTDVTAKWSVGTGYLPVRKSALEDAAVQAFLAENPRNPKALEALQYARTEPSVLGWQAARGLVEQATSTAIGGRTTPEEIARDLKRKADAALAQSRGPEK